MIERYSITAPAANIHERFSVEVPEFYKPRYNAAPTQLLPVITAVNPDGVSLFYWGTSPEWSKGKAPSEKVINIRVESLITKPSLKRALFKMRCIVPADGFYAWKKVGKKTLIPHRFVMKGQDSFSMAAVWEEYEDEDGNNIHTFMIFTVPANELVQTVHGRMPVLLTKQSEKVWLNDNSDEGELNAVLTSFPSDKMSLYTVSPRINKVEDDVPSLITPAPPADQHGNLTLFD